MPRLIAPQVARALQARIDAGEWAGSRVPPERHLATDLGVARNTVRRAMQVLEASGAVTRHVGRGTFVTPASRPSMADAIARMEGASPADMMEIRLLLEPAATAFAATHASSHELAGVAEAHLLSVSAADMPSFEHWDAEFHHRIFECSRNELLREFHALLRVLRNRSPWFEMKQRSFSEPRRQSYCEEHAAIVAALLQHDPESARAAMYAHLRTVEANILGR